MSTAGLSLNQATTRRWTVEEAVRGCAEAGIPGIGLWRDAVAAAGAERAGRLARAAGLTVTSLCRGGFFTGPDRAAARADNRHAVQEAAAVGAPVLVLVCGGLPAGSRDLAAARRLVADGIAELAPFAAAHGVRLAIEPMHPMFCADRSVVCTLAQALALAGQFPPEQVGVMVDAYHVWWDPGAEEAIAAAGTRIAGYQVSDWVLPLGSDVLLARGHVGGGRIDFRRLGRALATAGYQGWTEVEIFSEAVWAAPGARTLRTVVERYRKHLAPAYP